MGRASGDVHGTAGHLRLDYLRQNRAVLKWWKFNCPYSAWLLRAGVTRWGALAGTSVALLGLLKLNMTGPGVTQTVKELWKK